MQVTRQIVFALTASALAVAAPRAAHAQFYYPNPSFDQREVHFGISGGAAVPTGSYASDFNAGWNTDVNLAIPLGYHSPLWLQFDGAYSRFYASDQLLANFGANTGFSSMTSGTANLVINLVQGHGRRSAPITPYLIGGGGIYSRYIQVGNYTLYPVCNPYFGCGYAPGGTDVTFARTQTVGGWDAGGGLRFAAAPFRIFIESRYNSALTTHGPSGFVPITLGIEW